MISFLHTKIQDRRGKLTTYLNNNTDELPLEKQHQLYGAISELETISKIVWKHRNKEIKMETKNPDEVFLLKPIESKGFIGDIMRFIKDMF